MQRTALALPALGGLLIGLGCSAEGAPTPTGEAAVAGPPRHSELLVSPDTDTRAIRAASIAEAQRSAGPSFRVTQSQSGGLQARSHLMGFTSEFEHDGVRVGGARASGWRIVLRTERFGCAGAMDSVVEVTPTAADNRVRFERPGLSEWYLNGPLGLELGFTLGEAPPCIGAGNSEVVFELSVVGAEASASPAGDALVLVNDSSGPTLHVTDLWATDAAGAPLAAHLSASGSQISLHVGVSGADFPVVIDPLIWVEERKLMASDGESGDSFGESVSVSEDTIVVGASADRIGGVAVGSAYVFVRSGASWTEQRKLTAGDGEADDRFGAAVSVSGDTALVGAGADADNGSESGSAYVFVRSGTAWTQQQKLTASDAATGSRFGNSVSLSGDTALVGADESRYATADNPGSAYVYVRSGSTWTEQQILIAPDGEAADRFGYSVAVLGDTALVGAPADDDPSGGPNSGSAHFFERSGTTWSHQQKLTADDPAGGDFFGSSVSLSDGIAVIGAMNDDDNGSDRGAAYVFVRSGSTWIDQQKLTASDSEFSRFGRSVASAGDVILAGAPENSQYDGAVYVFTRQGSVWTEQSRLTAGSVSFLGWSVATSGSTAVAGAPADSGIGATGAGAAYVLTPRLEDGDPCTDGLACASQHCVDGVCCAATCDELCTACVESNTGQADGTCAPILDGQDPDDECAQEEASTCRQDGFCDGARACRLWAAGTECAAQGCADATSFDQADTCDGSGNCDDNGTTACASGYACVLGACRSSCAQDSDCASDSHCSNGACVPDQVGGAACDNAQQCDSGFCADGVCCDSDCQDVCLACTAKLKGSGRDGVCGPVAADTDPGNECAEDAAYPESCGRDGECDGSGACRAYALSGTVCRPAACLGDAVARWECDGTGRCVQAAPEDCSPYACASGACRVGSCTDREDCAENAFCNSNGQCGPQRDLGQSCSSDDNCDSDRCVDGVCCDGACAGQCEACDVTGHTGTCVPATGSPHGDRPACSGTDAQCRGECDGARTARCTYPTSGSACGTLACEDGEAVAHECDGAGDCRATPPEPCSPYVCGGTACLTECESDHDCDHGFACDDGDRECIPASAECVDGIWVVAADGTRQDCTPFACDGASGTCFAACTSVDECAPDHRCDADGNCIPTEDAEPEDAGPWDAEPEEDDSACGCRAGGASSRAGLQGLAMLLALGWLGLRRRQRGASS